MKTQNLYPKIRLLTLTLVACFLVFSFNYNVLAYSDVDESLEEIREIFPDFLINQNNITKQDYSLESPLGEAILTEFYFDTHPIGYSIKIGSEILEFAEKPSPYYLYTPTFSNLVLYYDLANYGVIENEQVTWFEIVQFD